MRIGQKFAVIMARQHSPAIDASHWLRTPNTMDGSGSKPSYLADSFMEEPTTILVISRPITYRPGDIVEICDPFGSETQRFVVTGVSLASQSMTIRAYSICDIPHAKALIAILALLIPFLVAYLSLR